MRGVEEVSLAGEEWSLKPTLPRVRTQTRQKSGAQDLINFEGPETYGRQTRNTRLQLGQDEESLGQQNSESSGELGSRGRKPRNARLQLGRSTAE